MIDERALRDVYPDIETIDSDVSEHSLGIDSHQKVQWLTELLLDSIKEAEITANQSTKPYATARFVHEAMVSSSYLYGLLDGYAQDKGNVDRLEVYTALGDMFSYILVICALFDISLVVLLKAHKERILEK